MRRSSQTLVLCLFSALLWQTGATGHESRAHPWGPVFVVFPDYPPLAWGSGLELKTTIRLLVGKSGQVLEVEPVEPPELYVLFESTIESALRRWLFEPLAEPLEIMLDVNFVLELTSERLRNEYYYRCPLESRWCGVFEEPNRLEVIAKYPYPRFNAAKTPEVRYAETHRDLLMFSLASARESSRTQGLAIERLELRSYPFEPPSYAGEALEEGDNVVELVAEVLIGGRGEVMEISCSGGEGNELLESFVKRTIRSWRFNPRKQSIRDVSFVFRFRRKHVSDEEYGRVHASFVPDNLEPSALGNLVEILEVNRDFP